MSDLLPCPVCRETPTLRPRHRDTFPRKVRQSANYSCQRGGHFISAPSWESPETVPLTDPRLEAGARVKWNEMVEGMTRSAAA